MFVFGVVACLVLTYGQAASIVDVKIDYDYCTLGAQYWCSSAVTAGLCGKTEWCAKNQWSGDVVQEVSCNLAMKFIEGVRNIVRSSANKPGTENDIALFITKSCLLSENDSLCKDLVASEESLFKIIMLADTDMSTQAIAAALGACRKSVSVEEPFTRCADLVSNVQKHISEIIPQKALQDVLSESCQLFPATDRSECQTWISTYTEAVMEVLSQELKPQQVCSLLGLSNTSQAILVNEIMESPKDTDIKCPLCKLIINLVKSHLSKHATQDQIKAALEKACNFVSPIFRSGCKMFIDQYEPQLIQLLLSALSSDKICKQIRLCSADEEVLVNEFLESSTAKPARCTLCKLVINKVKSFLGKNSTQDQIKAALGKVCDKITPTFKSQCRKLIDKYGSELIQLLLSAISTDEICRKIKLCATIEEANEILESPSHVDVKCTLCKLTVDLVKSLLIKNSTRYQIKVALQKVCKLVPYYFQVRCQKFINKYEPQLIQLLFSALSSDKICTLIRLCAANEEVSSAVMAFPSFPEELQLDDGPLCVPCEFAIQKLKSIIVNNASQQQVEAAIEKVCGLLPPDMKQICNVLAAQYVSVIYKLLLHVPTRKVCELLKLCSKSEEVAVNEILQSPSDNIIECDLCKLVINKLKHLVSKNATQDKIKSALEKVCHLLPHKLKAKCTKFVDKYEAEIIQLLLSAVTPEKICERLLLCAVDEEVPVNEVPESSLSNNIDLCNKCESVVDQVRAMLNQHETQDQIKAALKAMCHSVPLIFRQKCIHFVDDKEPIVVQMLLSGASSEEVCVKISLCKRLLEEVAAEEQSLMFVPESKAADTSLPTTGNCMACKSALLEVQSELVNPIWQNKLTTVLYELCTYLENGQDVCRELGDASLNDLVKEIRADQFPIVFCQAINICELPAAMVKEEDSCSMCTMLTEMVGSCVHQKKTVPEAEEILTHACILTVPEEQKPQCLSMVIEHNAVMTELMSQLNDPTTVCEKMKLCAKSSQGTLFQILRSKGN